MLFEFKIPDKPGHKARPKFGNRRAYTPKKTVEYEKQVRMHFADKYGTLIRPTEGEVRIVVRAIFPPNKSDSKKVRALKIAGAIPYLKKPDHDNISKVVCDALNGIVFKDDCQITKCLATKEYGEFGMIKVSIYTDGETP